MKFIVLHGRPAVGKLAVARELAQLSQWRLFHNHLVVDALLAVFDFGSAPFVDLRESIWHDVFLRASTSGVPGLIFTFAPETTVRPAFIDRLVADARARGDDLHFIELTCSVAEAEQRLTAASRLDTGKLTSVELYRKLVSEGAFDQPRLPPPDFSLDTGSLPPAEAARQIWQRLNR